MKSHIYIIITLLSVACLSAQNLTWTHVEGDYGNEIRTISVDSTSNIIISTEKGIYISPDEGVTWKAMNNGLPDSLHFHTILVNSKNEIYTAAYKGIFKYDRNSEVWEDISYGLWNNSINQFAINSKDELFRSENIFYSTFIYKMNYANKTWEEYDYNWDELVKLIFNSNDELYKFYENGDYHIPGVSIYYSDVGYTISDVMLNSSDHIFLITWRGILLKSTDNGKTWMSLFDGLNYRYDSSCIEINHEELIIGTKENGIFYTNNGGDVWEKCNEGLTTLKIKCLKKFKSKFIVGSVDEGLFISNDPLDIPIPKIAWKYMGDYKERNIHSYDVTFIDSGKYFINSVGNDLIKWDLITGDKKDVIKRFSNNYAGFTLSPSEKYFLSIYYEDYGVYDAGGVKVYDFTSLNYLHSPKTDFYRYSELERMVSIRTEFDFNDKYLVVSYNTEYESSDIGASYLVDLKDGNQIKNLFYHHTTKEMKFSKAGHLVQSFYNSALIKHYSGKGVTEKTTSKKITLTDSTSLHNDTLYSWKYNKVNNDTLPNFDFSGLRFSPDSKILIGSGWSKEEGKEGIYFWNSSDGSLIKVWERFKDIPDYPTNKIFSPDGKYLIMSYRNSIKFYDYETILEVESLDYPLGTFGWNLQWTPDSVTLATVSWDGILRLFKPKCVSKELNALFTPDSTAIPVLHKLRFHDFSSGNPTSWHWDFGDGGTSNLQNPEHIYMNKGMYTVTLIVSNGETSDTLTKEQYIDVYKPLVPDFTASTIIGEIPLTVKFENKSKGDVLSYQWDFGDSTTSSHHNPIHTYQKAGVYSVTLITSDERTSDTLIKQDYVEVLEILDAEFEMSETVGEVSFTVEFTDKSAGSPHQWLWKFGDNNQSVKQNPTHTYTSPGYYTVSLRATNKFRSDTETKPNYIIVRPPTSVNESYESDFVRVYPNPAGEIIFFNIKTEFPCSSELCIYDVIGTKILSKSILLTTGENLTSLDLKKLISGIYLYRMTFKKQIFYGSFVVR